MGAGDDHRPGFPGDDRTVLRPRPGGAPGRPDPVHPSASVQPAAPPAAGEEPPTGVGINPLVGAATALLVLATEIRHTVDHPDPEGLRNRVVDAIQRFEEQARAAGQRDEVVISARYVLCAFVDEAVLGTPWGSQSSWSREGMLITFHREAWGGEKFFLLLERLLANPRANQDLLELMYVILSLGFQGRYGPRPDGHAALERLRQQVYTTLRELRGEVPRELSPHWQGVERPQRSPARVAVLWVTVAVAAAVLLGLYLALAILLNRVSDPVYLDFDRLDARIAALLPRAEPRPPPAPAPKREPAPSHLTLRELLSDEVMAGHLDVIETPERSRVILFGDGMFPSGSDRIRPDYMPVLEKVADALRRIPGRVLVTGHTDDRPIRTLRFPSNWHLSQARAEAAVRVLARRTAEPDRFYAEGRAHTEPLGPNDTPAQRARNRRVEITLYYAREQRPHLGSGGR